MLATGRFQDVIEPPSQSDIVVLILWSRLGTPLPVNSDKNAISRHRRTRAGHRHRMGIRGRARRQPLEGRAGPSRLSLEPRAADLAARSAEEALAESQWSALESFWSRYFQAGGVPVGLSRLRRSGRFRRHAGGASAPADPAPGSRRNGGRGAHTGAEVRRLLAAIAVPGPVELRFSSTPDLLRARRGAAQGGRADRQNANEGKAFLLVLGASGSGRVVAGAGRPAAQSVRAASPTGRGCGGRRSSKPGDANGNLFLGLARVLVEDRVKEDVGLPKSSAPASRSSNLRTPCAARSEDPGFRLHPGDRARHRRGARLRQDDGARKRQAGAGARSAGGDFTDASISTEAIPSSA